MTLESRVSGNQMIQSLAIELTIDQVTYYITNAWYPYTLAGNAYTQLGELLTVGDIQEDLRTSGSDIQIALSGIPGDQDYVTAILNSPIKGGRVTIRRVFHDDHGDVPGDADAFTIYRGVITNYTTTEESDVVSGELTRQVLVTCASLLTVLENTVNGQRTNTTDRQRYYPGDISFDRVKELQNTQFDFGRDYTAGSGYGGGSGGGGRQAPEIEINIP